MKLNGAFILKKPIETQCSAQNSLADGTRAGLQIWVCCQTWAKPQKDWAHTSNPWRFTTYCDAALPLLSRCCFWNVLRPVLQPVLLHDTACTCNLKWFANSFPVRGGDLTANHHALLSKGLSVSSSTQLLMNRRRLLSADISPLLLSDFVIYFFQFHSGKALQMHDDPVISVWLPMLRKSFFFCCFLKGFCISVGLLVQSNWKVKLQAMSQPIKRS